MSIFDDLVEVQQAQYRGLQTIDQFDCEHPSTHFEEATVDELPGSYQEATYNVEVCDNCGEEIYDSL